MCVSVSILAIRLGKHIIPLTQTANNFFCLAAILILSMATGGKNCKIQRLSTFLSNELTNKPKKKCIYKIETNKQNLHGSVWSMIGHSSMLKQQVQQLNCIALSFSNRVPHVWRILPFVHLINVKTKTAT